MAMTPRDLVNGVLGDEEIRDRARLLALSCLDRAQEIIEDGTPEAQVKIIAAMMPTIGKTLLRAEKTESEVMAEMRRELQEIMVEVRDYAAPTTS